MDSVSRFGKTIFLYFVVVMAHTGCTGSGDGIGFGGISDQITQSVSVSPVGGNVPLAVTANANASNLDVSGIISTYQWDFGDGTIANTAVANHTYSAAGTYPITLTVTLSDGTQYSLSDTVYAYNSGDIDNSTATAAAASRIYDTFEYTVDRTSDPIDPSGLNNPFTTHGWTAAKAVNISGSHNGFLYTTTEIPGYTGNFPGRNSSRVLAIEALPHTMNGQTDFYLQYDNPALDREAVPAEVWFQFWIYANRYNDPTDQNDQLSHYHSRSKFIYPCNGTYPCSEGNLNWLNMLGYTTGEPFWANEDPSQLFMTTVEPFNVSINYQLADPGNEFKIGQTNVDEYIKPHRWTLVKIHYNTAGAQGIYEAWMKPMGGAEVKVAEWIGGITPDFTWPVASIGGHRVFRIPTTIDIHDYWIYLDDFVMTTAEGNLPTYTY